MKLTVLSIALASLAMLTGCATTGTTAPETASQTRGLAQIPTAGWRSDTDRAIDNLFTRHEREVDAGDGMNAAVTLNGYFSFVRAACVAGNAPCREACNRRPEMRRRMNSWNDNTSHRFARHGERVVITWDGDIDMSCDVANRSDE